MKVRFGYYHEVLLGPNRDPKLAGLPVPALLNRPMIQDAVSNNIGSILLPITRKYRGLNIPQRPIWGQGYSFETPQPLPPLNGRYTGLDIYLASAVEDLARQHPLYDLRHTIYPDRTKKPGTGVSADTVLKDFNSRTRKIT